MDRQREKSFAFVGPQMNDPVSSLIRNRPVRTYNTAAVYYHKFRLAHPENIGHLVRFPAMTLLIFDLTTVRMQQQQLSSQPVKSKILLKNPRKSFARLIT